MVNVFVVDDQPVLASGIVQLLSADRRLKVLGMSHSGKQAVQEIIALQPDVVVQDVHLPDMSGAEVMRQVREQLDTVRFLFFSVLPENSLALQLICEGADGFVNKSVQVETMIEGILTVAQGKRFMSPLLSSLYLDSQRDETQTGEALLSRREREVFLMLAKGIRQREIREKMNLAAGALSSYIIRIHRKLGTQSIPELIRYAIEKGLAE